MPNADDVALSDGDLLRKCQEGDEVALAELIRRYQDRLYRLALHVSGDETLAEEATVESFYKVWLKTRQWRNESAPDAWIYRIAVRTVLDLKRGRQRWRNRVKRAGLAEEKRSVPDVIETMAAAERHQRLSRVLEEAINQLRTEDRALVYMFYYESRGLRDIAEILNVSHDALKMRLSRARKRLREHLQDFKDSTDD